MPFPASPLLIRVELALGADLTASPATWSWTDVTTWFRAAVAQGASGITITRGKADEAGQADPSKCALTFDNRDGRFTPRNPLGAYFGLLRRNTPLRVRFDAGTGTGWVTRFTGYVSEWPPRWDLSGKDAWAPVVANGLLRRLGQGEEPLDYPLSRAIKTGSPQPKQYWSLVEGADASRAGSGLGLSPMTVTGTVRFGADSGLPGSGSLPDFSDGGRLLGSVPSYTVGGSPSFTLDGWFRSTGSTTHVPLECYTAGTLQRFAIEVTSTAVFARAYNFGGAEVTGGAVTLAGNFMDERWHNVRLEVTTSGITVDIALFVDGVAGSTSNETQVITTVAQVAVNWGAAAGPLLGVGHVGVWSSASVPDWNLAGHGYRGETAGERIQRVCGENGVPYQSSGVEADSEPMGPQPPTLTGILRDCEATDGGILYESTGGHIAYLTRRARYNRPVALALDFAAGHIAAAPEPTDDDQRIRNDVTATRTGGSSARFVDQASVDAEGRYDEQVTINPATDDVLAEHAAWRVHVPTVDEMRWPSIVLNLGNTPGLIAAWLAADIGFRLTAANPPAQVAGQSVDLVAEGWSEYTDGDRLWTVELNCAPARPWTIATVEGSGDTVARVDSDGSTLATAATLSGTSLSVGTAGNLWTTTATIPADLPFDIEIGGEQMTVTAISGTSSPQTFTVTRAVNGISKAHSGGAVVRLWRQPAVGL